MRAVVVVRAPDGGEDETVADVEIGAAIFASEIKWFNTLLVAVKVCEPWPKSLARDQVNDDWI